MLFIDTNNNQLEIKTAKETARKLGKKLIVYPEKKDKYDARKVQELLETTKFETLIISGHNGGGHISGDGDAGDKAGSLSYGMVSQYMEKNKFAKENASTLMLLGCFTGNHDQMVNWKSLFPNMKVIAGYDGKAPRGTTAIGHDYIREILKKKDKIYNEANAKKLEASLRGLKNIYNLDASIYIDARSCGSSAGEYIFRPLREKSERFKKFDIAECAKKINEYQEMAKLYQKYKDGALSFNSPNAGRDLLKVNSFLRKNNHCFQNMMTINPDESLYMRFWPEVRHNITEHFKDDLNSFFSEVNKLSTDKEYLKKILQSNLADMKREHNKYAPYLKTVNGKTILDRDKLKRELVQKNKEATKRLKKSEGIVLKHIEDLTKEFNFPKDELRRVREDILYGGIPGPSEQFFTQLGYPSSIAAKLMSLSAKIKKDKNIKKEILAYKKDSNDMNGSFMSLESLKHYPKMIEGNYIHSDKVMKAGIADLKKKIENSGELQKRIAKSIPIKSIKDAKTMTREDANRMAHVTAFGSELMSILPPQSKGSIALQKGAGIMGSYYYNLSGHSIPFSWHEIGDEVEPPRGGALIGGFSGGFGGGFGGSSSGMRDYPGGGGMQQQLPGISGGYGGSYGAPAGGYGQSYSGNGEIEANNPYAVPTSGMNGGYNSGPYNRETPSSHLEAVTGEAQ